MHILICDIVLIVSPTFFSVETLSLSPCSPAFGDFAACLSTRPLVAASFPSAAVIDQSGASMG